jgi:bifunctional DNase/RNase
VELHKIIITETSEEQIVILKEKEGERQVPIVIGIYEAAALDRKIKNAKTPRPLTHDLIEGIMKSLEAQLTKIVVTDLRNNTFYAKLTLKCNGKEVEVDSRPSDALVLAVQFKAPVYIAEKVLNTLVNNQEEQE